MARPGPENGWREPWWRRFSWRTTAIIATALFLFGYPVYVYMDALITGGITRQGNLLVVDLKAMSSFEMDQDAGTTEDIPKRYRQLDGKRVLLIGQMWEPYTAEGKIRNFTLVYSISNCCFNGPPKVQHFIQASVHPETKSTIPATSWMWWGRSTSAFNPPRDMCEASIGLMLNG